MTIKAVVFDIGGVLENTPPTGWKEVWENKLTLAPGQLRQRMYDTWRAGSIGAISLEEVHVQTADILELGEAQVSSLMDDLWAEYLGTLNQELYDYFESLRPQYQTAILSNSFVGAREKEQAHYKFEDICDFIIYSHEVGMAKPNTEIYALTCKRLELEPSEVVFLDDAKVCVEAARAFGMRGVLFENTAQAISEIEILLNSG